MTALLLLNLHPRREFASDAAQSAAQQGVSSAAQPARNSASNVAASISDSASDSLQPFGSNSRSFACRVAMAESWPLDDIQPNPALSMMSAEEAYTSLLEIGLPEAWVQKVGRQKNATPSKMAMITQIIDLGASAWPFDLPLENLKADDPNNVLQEVTLGQYWLWMYMELGDDYLWDQFETYLPKFDSTLVGEALQQQALLMLTAIHHKQNDDLLYRLATRQEQTEPAVATAVSNPAGEHAAPDQHGPTAPTAPPVHGPEPPPAA